MIPFFNRAEPSPASIFLFGSVRCLEATDKSGLLQPSNDPVIDQIFNFDGFQFGIARL